MKNIHTNCRNNALVNAVRPLVEGLESRQLLTGVAILAASDPVDHPDVLDTLYVTGSDGDDTISLLRSSNNQIKVVFGGASGSTQTFDPTGIKQISVNLLNGNDNLTVTAFTSDVPSTTNPDGWESILNIDPGAGNDSLFINGTTGFNQITSDSSGFSISYKNTSNQTVPLSAAIRNNDGTNTPTSFEHTVIDGRGGFDNLNIGAGNVVDIHYSQKLNSLTLGNNAKANLTAGKASSILLKSSPVLGSGAFINVNDNAIVVDYTGGSSPFAALKTHLINGMVLLGGSGADGIGSGTVADGINVNTTDGTFLTIVDNGEIGGAVDSRSFMDEIPADSVIITFTWFGDSNLDGTVGEADYALLDSGFTSGGELGGWIFGDYDLSNVVDGSDYALIDSAFISQSVNPFSLASMLYAPSPSHVAVEALSSTEVKLNWTAAPGLSATDYYMIFASEDGDNYQLIGTTKNTSIQFYSNLSGSVQFKVAAHYGTLISASKDAVVSVGGTPSSSGAVELSLLPAVTADTEYHSTDTTGTISWVENDSTITSYQFTYTPLDNTEAESGSVTAERADITDAEGKLTYTINGFSPDTTYQITITPLNSAIVASNVSSSTGSMIAAAPNSSNSNSTLEPGSTPVGQKVKVNTQSRDAGTIWLGNGTPKAVKVDYSPKVPVEAGPFNWVTRYDPKTTDLGNETVTYKVSNIPKHTQLTWMIDFGSSPTWDQNLTGDIEIKIDGQVINPSDGEPSHHYAIGIGWMQGWHYEGYYAHQSIQHTSDSATVTITGTNFTNSYRWGGYGGSVKISLAAFMPVVDVSGKATVAEPFGNLANNPQIITVSRPGDENSFETKDALTVDLESTIADRISGMPSSVTIPANKKQYTFEIKANDDDKTQSEKNYNELPDNGVIRAKKSDNYVSNSEAEVSVRDDSRWYYSEWMKHKGPEIKQGIWHYFGGTYDEADNHSSAAKVSYYYADVFEPLTQGELSDDYGESAELSAMNINFSESVTHTFQIQAAANIGLMQVNFITYNIAVASSVAGGTSKPLHPLKVAEDEMGWLIPLAEKRYVLTVASSYKASVIDGNGDGWGGFVVEDETSSIDWIGYTGDGNSLELTHKRFWRDEESPDTANLRKTPPGHNLALMYPDENTYTFSPDE